MLEKVSEALEEIDMGSELLQKQSSTSGEIEQTYRAHMGVASIDTFWSYCPGNDQTSMTKQSIFNGFPF